MMVAGGVPVAAGGAIKKRSVTFNHLLVPSTQTNFPVLINVTDVGLKSVGNGGNVQSANGYDIRPYSDSGLTSAMTYELDFFNASTGNVVMWVLIPSLSSASDTVIYLRYGDSTITTDGSSSSTWDGNYLGVWHLGNGSTLSLLDSTSNGYTLTNTASVGATTGQINGAAGSFNGTSQALSTGVIDFASSAQVTLEMWLDWTAYANNDDLLAETSTNFNSNDKTLFIDPNSSGSSQFDVSAKGIGGTTYNGGHFTRPASGLKHFVFTWDFALSIGGALMEKAYVNGAAQTITQDTSQANNTLTFSNYSLYLMSRGASSLFGAGKLDEVRLSKTARSANYVTTCYNNQSDPATFETLGTEGPA